MTLSGRERATAMYSGGAKYSDISKALGISHATATRWANPDRAKQDLECNRRRRATKEGKVVRARNQRDLCARDPEYRSRQREGVRAWVKSEAGKDWLRSNHRLRWTQDVQYRLRVILRSRANRALKSGYKTGSFVRDLGCSVAELQYYLESQFTDGMTWNNHGEWHIDHKLPLSSFDLTDRNQFLKACNYTNLQPLWASDNLKKGALIVV